MCPESSGALKGMLGENSLKRRVSLIAGMEIWNGAMEWKMELNGERT